jgi:enoyl-CoA hydratase/carnithine racemase
MAQPIHLSRPMPHVALIEIDNPPSNALGRDALAALHSVLGTLEEEIAVRAVILTGTGRAFCAGADLRERAGAGGLASSGTAMFGAVLDRLDSLRPATIAAVNGHAFGGGLELALCCDLRIASEGARFAAAGVNVGLMASVYRLPRLIGVARAKAMLLTGAPVSAETALQYGLVTDVHSEDALREAAHVLASRIASRAPLAVEAAKRQAGRALDMSPEESQRAARDELRVLTASEDHRAAVAAFAERSEPVFGRK